MVMSCLGFLFASYILDFERKKPTTQQCQRAQTKKLQQKSALSSQRTNKGTVTKTENFQTTTTVFPLNTTEKTVVLPPSVPVNAELGVAKRNSLKRKPEGILH